MPLVEVFTREKLSAEIRAEDDTGIFTMCVEIDDGQWAVGAKIPALFSIAR